MVTPTSNTPPDLWLLGSASRGLGIRLRQRRAELRITQEELARVCNVRPQTVSAWESGSRPQARFLEPIAEFLGLAGGKGDVLQLLETGTVTPRVQVAPSLSDVQLKLLEAAATQLANPRPDDRALAVLRNAMRSAGLWEDDAPDSD